MNTNSKFGDKSSCSLRAGKELSSGVKLGGVFTVKCLDPNGDLKWKEDFHNTVVNEGLNHILDVLFVSATTQTDPWYIGLTDGTPTVAAADTAATHAGWTEVTAYTEATRPEFVESRTNQSVTNATAADFSINTNATTIGGAFLISANTKGGTSGILLCAEAFTGGDKSADSGDTLQVTYTFSAADV